MFNHFGCILNLNLLRKNKKRWMQRHSSGFLSFITFQEVRQIITNTTAIFPPTKSHFNIFNLSCYVINFKDAMSRGLRTAMRTAVRRELRNHHINANCGCRVIRGTKCARGCELATEQVQCPANCGGNNARCANQRFLKNIRHANICM